MTGFRIPGPVDRAPLAFVSQTGVRRQPLPAPPKRLRVDAKGHAIDPMVTLEIRTAIERAPMKAVHGIVLHQTGGSTAESALNSYKVAGANGAHFLIDKDGTIYQTASLLHRTNHVGALKSRCREERRCTPADLKALQGKTAGRSTGRVEGAKAWPDRYPGNEDAIGIEFVGAARVDPKHPAAEPVYEPVTKAQQHALDWLLPRLLEHFQVRTTEVFRHPDVSWKMPSEAASLRW